ncbi:hypothetical protein KIPB_016871, partial [Kipferlia bialata]|eukprot:g16871.t1
MFQVRPVLDALGKALGETMPWAWGAF